ncbi:hypothetical protein R75461_07286 [Paraburkholderia nemoris]|uniref:hypothetical protein n=1 Tax=Paraburkholderia nemoris TaxID=2793076 RepID=UPI00190E5370|nr:MULTISPECIES: hypothetical protein [Paraburkholderia]MBK3786061.1 hypothetical protein [Paraburkholderia aspalathi]CAE6846888.1 hypothetical protein R75461_07286 [Paraburkholderia nemoris]
MGKRNPDRRNRRNPLGNGIAVMPLQTVSKGPFYFNFHASRLKEDSMGEKVAGHTLFLGSTGTGKTVYGLQDLMSPIGRPVSERVTSFEDGRSMLTIRVNGMAFESVSRSEIENNFDALNQQKPTPGGQ